METVTDKRGRTNERRRRPLSNTSINAMITLLGQILDLSRERFKLADAETEAGVRMVEITLYLRDELVDYAMDRGGRALPHEPADHFFGTGTGRRRDLDLEPTDHFFGTGTGRRRDQDRFGDRILARAVERANTKREQSGLPPCRTLRRIRSVAPGRHLRR